MTQLIINADDFGLHPSINEAVAKGVEAGVINSISVSMPGNDVDVHLLKELASKGVFIGLHLTWVGEKWLTGGNHVRDWKEFIFQYALKKPSLVKALEAEANAQLEAYQQIGIPLDHIDGHQHLHVFPSISDFVIEMANTNNSCRVRVPHTPDNSLRRPGLGGAALQYLSKKLLAKQKTPFYCIGIKHSGHYDSSTLLSEMHRSRVEKLEIVIHPGTDNHKLSAKYPSWRFDWESEHKALLSENFREAIAKNYELLRKKT